MNSSIVVTERRKLALSKLESAIGELDSVSSITGVKDIRDKAEAIRLYAHNAHLGLEVQNKAAELRLRAERKAGNILKSMKLRGGDRKSSGSRDRLSLNALGISQNQSKRWQKEATVPNDEFEEFIRDTTTNHRELTAAALVRLADASPVALRSKRRTRQNVTVNANTLSPLINEMVEHCRMLQTILAPFCDKEDNSDHLQDCERRLVRRLLEEIQQHANVIQNSGS